ncbi:hypothetical protein BGX26_006370 [Mortierella sp. AD094]|nr:hypothetical protein BGX26_006370 [Mortierella sp. AD094]
MPLQELPLEIWFHILNQALNMLLPMATTPRLYSTYIAPLLLTSHTFHEHCHPVTYPHLRKHKLLQLFTRWKAAHSREVHFYHHPLRNHVRYALPDRVGNPPGEEYETLYSFIKRSYLFGCESVCGTVIPVEGGLEVPILAPTPVPAPAPAQANDNDGAAANATATNNPTPASVTGTGANAGNVVVAPPPAQATAPVATNNGGDGGGQGWKSHALQWHVANPTFAAEGTIDLYKEIVEEYRRVVCGSAAARERDREIERAMDMMKNPHRYAEQSTTESQANQLIESEQEQSRDIEEDDDEDEEEEEHYIIEQDENELLSEIEAKGGLRRRDSGHAQSSSEMDIDEDIDDEEDDEDMMSANQRRQALEQEHKASSSELGRSRSVKREPETMAMDYQMESITRHRRGLRSRKLERSLSANEKEQLIMDMALDKPYHPLASLAPFHPLETKVQTPPSPTLPSSPSEMSLTRSGSPVPFTPSSSSSSSSSSRKSRENSSYSRSKSSRSALQRSLSSPGSTSSARISNQSQSDSTHSLDSSPSSSPSSSSSPSTLSAEPINPSPSDDSAESGPITIAPTSDDSSMNVDSCFVQPQACPLRAEDLDFDLASACANTFASDLAFVLARVPGLGAHFHRFEQLAKLKLHVGWAKHAQSRGGNDVFVMSCSRLISLLAPLANTPLVSERGG